MYKWPSHQPVDTIWIINCRLLINPATHSKTEDLGITDPQGFHQIHDDDIPCNLLNEAGARQIALHHIAASRTSSRAPSEWHCREPVSLGPARRPKARGSSRAGLRKADRIFACQCCCSDPCIATHQASRMPRPQASGSAGSPPGGHAEDEGELSQILQSPNWIDILGQDFGIKLLSFGGVTLLICSSSTSRLRSLRPSTRS